MPLRVWSKWVTSEGRGCLMGIDGSRRGKVWATDRIMVGAFVFPGWITVYLLGIFKFLFRFEVKLGIYKRTNHEYTLWITPEGSFSGILWEIFPCASLIYIWGSVSSQAQGLLIILRFSVILSLFQRRFEGDL